MSLPHYREEEVLIWKPVVAPLVLVSSSEPDLPFRLEVLDPWSLVLSLLVSAGWSLENSLASDTYPPSCRNATAADQDFF